MPLAILVRESSDYKGEKQQPKVSVACADNARSMQIGVESRKGKVISLLLLLLLLSHKVVGVRRAVGVFFLNCSREESGLFPAKETMAIYYGIAK